MADKLKLLLLLANPVDTSALRLGKETREIVSKIKDGSRRDAFEVIFHLASRPTDLQDILLEHEPHIVHFSGHSSLHGELLLENDAGLAHPTSRQSIARLFEILKDNLRLVVFNACLTKEQALEVSKHIDFTIGTNSFISDSMATAFAEAFYRGLAYGRTVRRAFELGQNELDLRGITGKEAAEFFVKEGANANEPLLPLKRAARPDRASDAPKPVDAPKLEAALAHLLSANAGDDEKRLLRRELINGRLVLESVEGAPENDLEILGAVDHSAGSSSIRLDVGPLAFQRIRTQLYPPPPGLSPPLPGLVFIGREDSMTDIKALLGVSGNRDSENVLTVVRGWPGVGKTTLVGMLGRDPEVLRAFPDGVLWTALERDPKLFDKLGDWGRALGVQDLSKVTTMDEAVGRLTALISARRMLLIVDDIWNHAHAVPFLKISAGSNCPLLTTTRLTTVAEALSNDERCIYVLPVLTEESAMRLLRYLAPAVVEQHPEPCRELVKDIEYLPLAIHVAGRLLKSEAKRGFGVLDLIKGIREGAKLLPQPAPLDRAEGATIPTVAALLQRSTDMLDERTRDCFAVLGAFAPKPATFDLGAMKAVWRTDDPKPVIHELVDHGLLEPVGAGRFQVHALLVKHARSLLK